MVREMFDKDELVALGAECLALFQSLMEAEPRNQVPAQTDKPAQI